MNRKVKVSSEVVGVSIGLALKGFGELLKVDNSFKNLRASIKSSGLKLRSFTKDLRAIKDIGKQRAVIKTENKNLKDELKKIENFLRGAAFAVPVKLAIDFESSMADVKKVVDFESKEEFQKFSKEIIKLTRTIPLSAKELASITASGGQIGIAKDELMDYTTLVAKMGVAFDMSADVAGESLSNLKNSLQISMAEVESLGDTINHLSDNSAAKASNIIKAVARVGGVARVFKLSSDQTAALASSFISLGKAPEVAANSMNALLNKLMTAPQQGEKFQEALKQIGMDSKYLKIAIEKNPQEALNRFLGTLENVKDSEKMGILTNLFGTEYADDMALLVASLNEYKKAQNLINDENKKGSLDREFENRSKTTANSLTLLKSAIEEIGISFGSVFLPAISSFAVTISKLLNGVLDLINLVPGLTTVVSYAAASFLLLKPAILVYKLAKNYIFDTILAVRSLYKSLKIKIALYKNSMLIQMLRNKILAISNMIKTATIALYRRLNIVQRVNNMLVATGTALKKVYSLTVMGLSKAFNFLRFSVFTAATAFKVLKLALIGTGIGAIVVAIGMAAAYLIENWDDVKEFFSNFWQGIKEKWEDISNYFSELFSPVVEAWNSLFGGWFDWIGEKLSWLFSGIGKIASAVSSWFSSSNELKTDVSQDISYNNLELFAQPKAQVVANSSNGANTTYNINFSGDFSLFASSNGKFDLDSFQQQLVKATKEALSKEQFKKANTTIRG